MSLSPETRRGGGAVYQVGLDFLVLFVTIWSIVSIPFAVVQVLGAATAHVPNTHLFLPGLLGLWGLTVEQEETETIHQTCFTLEDRGSSDGGLDPASGCALFSLMKD